MALSTPRSQSRGEAKHSVVMVHFLICPTVFPIRKERARRKILVHSEKVSIVVSRFVSFN
jgi:hypothetical protein